MIEYICAVFAVKLNPAADSESFASSYKVTGVY